LAEPPPRALGFADLVEQDGVPWHSAAETARLLRMMSPLNRRKVEHARESGERTVGTIYRRTRAGRQRAEVRFDGISGCLRTPAGGSSRQTVVIVEGARTRSRLLSAREAARLMGVPDDYPLPPTYNDAYHLFGDGVAVPVVRYLAEQVLPGGRRP
jgi:DNA (cytosine-5)-methyltransferase 1